LGGWGGEEKKFSELVGHNPKKSGKFLFAPQIFSFRYAHEFSIYQVLDSQSEWQHFVLLAQSQ
jgi:hypothetical protein